MTPSDRRTSALLNVGSILWFDPRREHSSIRPPNLAAVARRACQGWPRLRGHPKGLALTGPSTAARSIGSGLEAAGNCAGLGVNVSHCADEVSCRLFLCG